MPSRAISNIALLVLIEFFVIRDSLLCFFSVKSWIYLEMDDMMSETNYFLEFMRFELTLKYGLFYLHQPNHYDHVKQSEKVKHIFSG